MECNLVINKNQFNKNNKPIQVLNRELNAIRNDNKNLPNDGHINERFNSNCYVENKAQLEAKSYIYSNKASDDFNNYKYLDNIGDINANNNTNREKFFEFVENAERSDFDINSSHNQENNFNETNGNSNIPLNNINNTNNNNFYGDNERNANNKIKNDFEKILENFVANSFNYTTTPLKPDRYNESNKPRLNAKEELFYKNNNSNENPEYANTIEENLKNYSNKNKNNKGENIDVISSSNIQFNNSNFAAENVEQVLETDDMDFSRFSIKNKVKIDKKSHPEIHNNNVNYFTGYCNQKIFPSESLIENKQACRNYNLENNNNSSNRSFNRVNNNKNINSGIIDPKVLLTKDKEKDEIVKSFSQYFEEVINDKNKVIEDMKKVIFNLKEELESHKSLALVTVFILKSLQYNCLFFVLIFIRKYYKYLIFIYISLPNYWMKIKYRKRNLK